MIDVMARIFAGPTAGVPGPADDYWYQPVGTMTEAGIRIDADGAKKLSAWYRGRDILATVLAMLPMQLMERLPNDGGSQPAREDRLYAVLNGQPNRWQDSFMWRRQKMYHLVDYGNGYDRILPGVSELWPIHPARVTPKQFDNGRLVYEVKDPKTLVVDTYTQDEIFHLCGASDDGIVGKGILEWARSSLGTSLATESYAANIYSKGTLNGGVIENPGTLDPEAARRMAQSFVTASREWHMPKVLEQGSKFVESKLTPEDAQMLLSRKHTVDDIARWLGVPRLMLENSDPSFGNAEQFTQNFLDINMGGWFALWEFACNRQLVRDPVRQFVRINRKAIVRANWKDLVEGTVALVNAGVESVDEARGDVLDMPKRGGAADELRQPQNITGKPAPSSAMTAAIEDPTTQRAQAIAQAAAERLLRKEIAAIQKAAVRHAGRGEAFLREVRAFYAAHVSLVVATLQLTPAAAELHCTRQVDQVHEDWHAALARWQTPAYAAGLAAIALEEETAA